MSSVVIVGAQWGDEGGGKVVDRYAARSKNVVRFKVGTTPDIRWWSRGKRPSST